jgi:hypothetical protein
MSFDVLHNHKLFEFFVDNANRADANTFSDNMSLSNTVDPLLQSIHWSVTKTNEIIYDLAGIKFDENQEPTDYLNQRFLNKQHADWVASQRLFVNIDSLRNSSNSKSAELGNRLHHMYPDEIRSERICPILAKLGYDFPYEEVNMTVHRLEKSFNRIEYSSPKKWNVFDNPYLDDLYSTNDLTNFSFNYTYVGRQYYDKFQYFDDNLDFDDHYNFEQLEFSFHLALVKPQTIPYSKEFISWADEKKVPTISTQIPIANIADLSNKIFEYRKMLYRNSKANNALKIIF